MARLQGGWTLLKTVGDVEPTRILVNRKTGEFGVLAVGSQDSSPAQKWGTLAEVEAFVKDINESGAIEALMAESVYHDEVVKLTRIRVKKIGFHWVRMDGTRLHRNTALYQPDDAVIAAVEAKRAAHNEAKERVRQLRDEAWDIVRSMQLLSD